MSKTNQDPARVNTRKTEAKARKEKTDALTPAQRLENLDMKFGAGKGATAERAKLADAISKPQVQKATPTAKPQMKAAPPANVFEELELQTLPDEVLQEIAALNDESNSKKKLKAKDRRARESHS